MHEFRLFQTESAAVLTRTRTHESPSVHMKWAKDVLGYGTQERARSDTRSSIVDDDAPVRM